MLVSKHMVLGLATQMNLALTAETVRRKTLVNALAIIRGKPKAKAREKVRAKARAAAKLQHLLPIIPTLVAVLTKVVLHRSLSTVTSAAPATKQPKLTVVTPTCTISE